MKQRIYLRRSDRSGLTLIEVVASITLAATAIVLILTAVAKHQRQLRHVSEQKQAAEHLDGLLADWFASSDPIPANSQGPFPNTTDFFWSTQSGTAINSNSNWHVQTVVVSVYRVDDPTRAVLNIELLVSANTERRSDNISATAQPNENDFGSVGRKVAEVAETFEARPKLLASFATAFRLALPECCSGSREDFRMHRRNSGEFRYRVARSEGKGFQ